jgi:hypothetical protein
MIASDRISGTGDAEIDEAWSASLWAASVRAKAAAIEALALNGGLDVAYTSRAYMQNRSGGLRGGRSGYKLAIKLKPDYATLYLLDAWHLMGKSKSNEGILDFGRSTALSQRPWSSIHLSIRLTIF